MTVREFSERMMELVDRHPNIGRARVMFENDDQLVGIESVDFVEPFGTGNATAELVFRPGTVEPFHDEDDDLMVDEVS